jgi:fructuronate reductase
MRRLSNDAMVDLPATVARPAYDRAAVTPGIVHLGVGAFHRAHQAVFVDDCLARGARDWGIVAASLRSPATRDALAPQDNLYTLAVRDSHATHHRIIGSILETIVAPDDPALLLARLCDPRIRIVSLTVTEKGYCIDVATGALHRDDPDIVHDLANPAAPRTALGFLVEAIARRRAAGIVPFAVLCCDNLPRNGETVRRALIAFAAARDQDLARYVETAVSCPSTMVDRIVPATTDDDREAVAGALGLQDAWPVVTEPFAQWVIEDRFPQGRPPFEAVGAMLVTDVGRHETMKLRLLNGAHTTLAAIGRLAGLATIAEAITVPAIRRLIDDLWDEVRPTLAVPAGETRDYTARLVDRFSNRALPHKTAQIANDASQKLPQRLLAPLRELRRDGAPCPALVLAIAAVLRSFGGVDDKGQPFTLNDPVLARWGGLPPAGSASARETVTALLGWPALFGDDFPRDEALVSALVDAHQAIAQRGILAVLTDRYPASTPSR